MLSSVFGGNRIFLKALDSFNKEPNLPLPPVTIIKFLTDMRNPFTTA